MPPHQVEISRHGAQLRLTGDPRTIAWVRFRGSSYFKYAEQPSHLNSWQIIAGREHASHLVLPMQVQDSVAPGTCKYHLNPEQRIIAIDAPHGPWRDLWTLRMVRHILRWQMLHQGAVFMHASVIAHAGQGMALLGRRRAGKTTLLLRAMKTGEFAFVCEDDLTLIPQSNGSLLALGWPGCVRVRRSMLSSFPEFGGLKVFEHPSNLQDPSTAGPEALLRIFPEELSSIFGCSCLPEVPLSSIACLEWADYNSVQFMNPQDIDRALVGAWDVLPERKPGTDLGLPPHKTHSLRGSCFNPFLFDVIGIPDLSQVLSAITTFANGLLGYRVRHTGGVQVIRSLRIEQSEVGSRARQHETGTQ